MIRGQKYDFSRAVSASSSL